MPRKIDWLAWSELDTRVAVVVTVVVAVEPRGLLLLWLLGGGEQPGEVPASCCSSVVLWAFSLTELLLGLGLFFTELGISGCGYTM